MLTQVQIKDSDGVKTTYANLIPAGQVLAVWLARIVQGVLLAPSNQRMFVVPGTNLTIDRKTITEVVATRDSS